MTGQETLSHKCSITDDQYNRLLSNVYKVLQVYLRLRLMKPDFMDVFVLSLAIATMNVALCYNGIYTSMQGPSYPATILIVSYTSPPCMNM